MGLANHRKALRAEIALYADQFRQQQVDAMTAALRRYGYEVADVPPVVWAVFATSVSRYSSWNGSWACRSGTPRCWRSARSGCAASRGSAGDSRRRHPPDGDPALPVAQRAERTLRALIGDNHLAVHGEHTVEVRPVRGVQAARRHRGSATTTFAYVEAPVAGPAIVFEIMELSDVTNGMGMLVRDAAKDGDGSDPIRTVVV